MEHMIQLHIEKLPEGMYLATSDEVQLNHVFHAPCLFVKNLCHRSLLSRIPH